MNIDDVTKLIKLLENSNLSEIEITEGKESIRLTKATIQPVNNQPSVSHINLPAQPPTPSRELPPSATLDTPPPQTINDNHHVIKSPMVGIFYDSPSPDAKPFFTIGQSVGQGDVLCIIEAMKIFNQIESDVQGKIVNCLVKSGQAVEFGQPLFTIES